MLTLNFNPITKAGGFQAIRDRCAVMLSGGPDSMALWSFLSHKKYDLPAIFVNHRTKASEEAESFLKKRYLNSPITYLKIKETLDFSEFNLSNLRYQTINSFAYHNKYNYYLMAHTLDDNVESHIMNSLKVRDFTTSGTPTSTIICPFSYRINTINSSETNTYGYRPIMLTSKQEILNYLHNNQIEYYTDKTNLDPDSNMRAYIRANMEVFRAVNPGIQGKIRRLIEKYYYEMS